MVEFENKSQLSVVLGVLGICLFLPAAAAAHSGRTNSSGCHNVTRTGGYHCHNGGTSRPSPPRVVRPPPVSSVPPATTTLKIRYASQTYSAVLLGCYDGDTCTVRFANTPAPLAQQSLRFVGFDTPEIRGKCRAEKTLAKRAKTITEAYVKGGGELILAEKNGQYGTTSKKGGRGRVLVSAPALQADLIAKGLARPYDGGKRRSWC